MAPATLVWVTLSPALGTRNKTWYWGKTISSTDGLLVGGGGEGGRRRSYVFTANYVRTIFLFVIDKYEMRSGSKRLQTFSKGEKKFFSSTRPLPNVCKPFHPHWTEPCYAFCFETSKFIYSKHIQYTYTYTVYIHIQFIYSKHLIRRTLRKI